MGGAARLDSPPRPPACLPRTLQAICSLIYAGERVATDLAEIAVVSKMLVFKYG